MSKQHFDESFGANAPENYERFFVPAIGRPLALDLVDTAALSSGECVLDVGCGTGIVARLASEKVGTSGSITGIDVNPGMLEVARSCVRSDTPVEWRQGSAEAMPLPDDTFDAVLCQMSLQFVPDRVAALKEMRRVLKLGGRVALNVPGPTPPMFEVFAKGMGRHIHPEADGFVRHVFSLHDTSEIEGLMRQAGFKDVATKAARRHLRLPRPKEFLWQYISSTPLVEIVKKANDEARNALEEDVVGKWNEFADDDGMTISLRVLVAKGIC